VAEVKMLSPVPRPSEVFGLNVNSVVTIFGVSFAVAETVGLAVLGDVYCVSSAGSVAIILMVMTVAVPTAASNLAVISTVFDV
jgi:hypothetical protein